MSRRTTVYYLYSTCCYYAVLKYIDSTLTQSIQSQIRMKPLSNLFFLDMLST